MENKTAVYFDGACHLCSREIDAYRKRDISKKLNFIDIAAENFDASAIGLDAKEVKRHLHVQTTGGSVVTGIDAFAEIWRELNILKGFIFLVEKQPSRFLLKTGYSLFALIRPLLPKKSCKGGVCSKK